jgi:hypothetical protein
MLHRLSDVVGGRWNCVKLSIKVDSKTLHNKLAARHVSYMSDSIIPILKPIFDLIFHLLYAFNVPFKILFIVPFKCLESSSKAHNIEQFQSLWQFTSIKNFLKGTSELPAIFPPYVVFAIQPYTLGQLVVVEQLIRSDRSFLFALFLVEVSRYRVLKSLTQEGGCGKFKRGEFLDDHLDSGFESFFTSACISSTIWLIPRCFPSIQTFQFKVDRFLVAIEGITCRSLVLEDELFPKKCYRLGIKREVAVVNPSFQIIAGFISALLGVDFFCCLRRCYLRNVSEIQIADVDIFGCPRSAATKRLSLESLGLRGVSLRSASVVHLVQGECTCTWRWNGAVRILECDVGGSAMRFHD